MNMQIVHPARRLTRKAIGVPEIGSVCPLIQDIVESNTEGPAAVERILGIAIPFAVTVVSPRRRVTADIT
jgi:hypothetical protein